MTKKSAEHTTEQIVAKSEKYDNTKFWIAHGIDIERRRIMLDEDVDEYSIGWVIRAIRKMIDADKTQPIDVYINSCGGSIYDGLALYDVLEACEYTTIRTHALGKIMSMALVVLMAGDERYSSPRATFMAHSASSEYYGKVYEAKIDTKELERLNNINLEILAERSKKTLAWWKKEIEFKDQYYDKTKAMSLGIITHDKYEVI